MSFYGTVNLLKNSKSTWKMIIAKRLISMIEISSTFCSLLKQDSTLKAEFVFQQNKAGQDDQP